MRPLLSPGFGATIITGRLASGPTVAMVTERFSTLGGEPAVVVVTERRSASGAKLAVVVMETATAGTEPLNIFFRASSTSSGLQVMPRFSLCAENQARIVVSGILEAAVSQDSSACVGYGNRVKDAVNAAWASRAQSYGAVCSGTATRGSSAKLGGRRSVGDT